MVAKKKTKQKVSKKKLVRRKSVKKKPVKKRQVKKKIVRRTKADTNSSVSRKDFETFQFGVQRLKELEKELSSLDTRGFYKEEQAIKSKLKNVSEIPKIEGALKILKAKIRNKYHPKHRRKSPTKEISEDIDDIKGAIKGLRRSRKESFEDIKGEIKKLKKPKLGVIDSGVGILVDTNFNSFLNQTKQSLSNRVKEKEDDMDNTLKFDLEKREENFRQRHQNLIREFNNKKKKLEEDFNKKYAIKVKTTLQKEIIEHFNEKLRQKLNAEKVQLGKVYKAQLRDHAQTELEKQKQILRDALEKSKEHIHEKLLREFNKKLHEDLEKREKIIRKDLVNEYGLKLEKKIEEHEQGLKKRKFDLELEMQKKIKQVLR